MTLTYKIKRGNVTRVSNRPEIIKHKPRINDEDVETIAEQYNPGIKLTKQDVLKMFKHHKSTQLADGLNKEIGINDKEEIKEKKERLWRKKKPKKSKSKRCKCK